jgi:hypothetical protein
MKELVGQGKPFYSAVDKAAGLLKRKVGTGAEFMQELKGLGGIKQSEIEDRGLGELMGAPKMTHEQFMAALAAKPAPAIREKVFGKLPDEQLIPIAKEMAYEQAYEELRDDGLSRSMAEQVAEDVSNENYQQFLDKLHRQGGAAYHQEFTIPGGENYREMLIKTPEGGEQFGGNSNHFGGEPGVLASMRLKDRTGPNGEKLLHLEELQSDWHQQGREKGYRGKADKEYTNYLNDLQERVKQAIKQEYLASGVSDDAAESLAGKMAQRMSDDPRKLANFAGEEDKRMELNKARVDEHNLVPNAPFKKNWEEMALKRLIHHAAENGYHGIVVTPGAEQADRYSLAKHIDDLHYSGTNLVAYDGEGNEIIKRTGVTPQELPSLVGKELAEKLMAQEPTGTLRSLRGVDMEVGGEGMKGFYDKKVPNILNSIGKKYGVKTELGGHTIQGRGRERTEEEFRQATQNVPFERHKEFDYEPKPIPLHHFPITEEMRKDVLTNGLPLHREGGIIHKAVGGQVQPSINQMRAELVKKMPTSLADLSSIGANEAPSMNIKAYVPPAQGGDLPVGGIDMNDVMQGIQFMPQESQAMQAPQQPQGALQGQPQGQPSPLSAGASRPQPPSNILQMTPQGQALNAMTPPQPARMAVGGSVPAPYKIGGSDNMPPPDNGWKPDNGVSTFNIDNVQQAAKGGSIEKMKQEMKSKGTLCMTHDHGYADGGRAGKKSSKEPKSTVKAYKLFRVHPKHPGKLFPLFVNANEPVEMNKWVEAQEGEMAGDKVKSKIGPLAYRPGWHAGDLPVATHIGEKSDPSLTAPDVRPHNHVWAEVEMPNDVDWQSVANERGMNPKGKLIERNAHITDQIPKGGHYRYKTNSNMTGNWLIGGAMKVNRILHDKEVKAINKAAKAKDLPRAQKQNLADYGFAKGGSTKGYLHHTDINPNPEVGKRFSISGVGEGLAPINEVNPETMMGGSFGIAPWDRSGSHMVNEVSGHELINPAKLQAGQNFPRMLKNVAEGRGGASGPKVVEAQQDRISRAISHNLGKKGTGKVYTSPSTMALGSEYFSHMPIEIQLDLMHQAGLHPKQIERLNEMVKKEKGMQNFVGFEHPSLWEHITGKDETPLSSPGKLRKAMSKVLSSKEGQQMLNYNEEDLLNAIEDPDLRGVPKGYAGRILLQGHPNEIRGTPFMDPNHESYSQGHRQKFVGGAQNAPIELWMPESFKKQKAMLLAKNKDLAKGRGFRDQIINSLAWSKAPHSYQMINEPVVQNLSRFKEGIKAGDIDPNDLPSTLDYFKRKYGGYKKGGKVKLSTNMDTINLELSRRTKKAK